MEKFCHLIFPMIEEISSEKILELRGEVSIFTLIRFDLQPRKTGKSFSIILCLIKLIKQENSFRLSVLMKYSFLYFRKQKQSKNKRYMHPKRFKKHVLSYFKKTIEYGKAPDRKMVYQFLGNLPEEYAVDVAHLDWKKIKARLFLQHFLPYYILY